MYVSSPLSQDLSHSNEAVVKAMNIVKNRGSTVSFELSAD